MEMNPCPAPDEPASMEYNVKIVTTRLFNQKRKGNCYALHNRGYFACFVASGVSEFLHHGRFHSLASGDRRRGRFV
jgi:hypothetical protein